MPRELFLIPLTTPTGGGAGGASFPKYLDNPAVESASALIYGEADTSICLVQAAQADLDLLAAQSDVQRLATTDNIDNPITEQQRDNFRAFVEGLGIPGNWIQTGETRRLVIRGLAGMFNFSRRLEVAFGENVRRKLANNGVNLETEWQDMPIQLQDELIATAISIGFAVPFPPWRLPYQPPFLDDEETIPNPEPVDYEPTIEDTVRFRAILRRFGNQYQTSPIEIGGFPL